MADLRRELAAAQRPGVAPASGAERCRAAAEREGGIVLGPGQRLVLHVDGPPRGALIVGRAARCGGASGGDTRVRIVAASDGAAATRTEVEVPARAAVAPLPSAGGPARLELALDDADGPPVLLTGLALGARDEAASGTAAATPRPRPHRRPHLLVYLIDALRRDALGVHGAPGGVSPHLDRLAAEGAVFLDAVAQAPWTRTAVASLFTGVDPQGHGVLTRRDALAPENVTLAERLAAAGYRTVAIIGNGNVGGRLGFRQGFQTMRQRLRGSHSATHLNAELLGWLDETRDDPRPFFAYVHTIDPHGPYSPAQPYRARFAPGVPLELGTRRTLRALSKGERPRGPRTAEQLRALYQAEVAASDAAFGELRAELERRGLWQDTAVVVVSDHGEEFLERGGLEHGKTLHAESLDIPLLLRVPGGSPGTRVQRLARQVDVMPTLLELAGVASPPGLDGESLVPALSGGEPLAPVAARSQVSLEGPAGSAVTTSRYRLIVTDRAGGREVRLFDRREDPGERRDLSAGLPIALAYLESVLRWPAGAGASSSAPELDEEDLEQLRALGYVE